MPECWKQLARNPGNVIGMTLWFNQAFSEPQDSELAHLAALNKNIVFSRPARTTNSSGRVLYKQLEEAQPTTAAEQYVDYPSGSAIGLTAIYTHLSSPVSRWLEVLPVKLFRIFQESQKGSFDPKTLDTNAFDFIRMYKLQFSSADPISLEPFIVKMPINYIGDVQAFQRLPYERLLEKEDFSWIRNKIIIIGLVLPGQGILTPLSFSTGILTSQPVVIANAVNTLLTGQYIRTLHPVITSGLLAIYCLLALYIFRKIQTSRKRIGIGIGIFFGLFVTNYFLFGVFRFQIVIFPFLMVWVLIHAYFAAKEFRPLRFVIGSTGAEDQK